MKKTNSFFAIILVNVLILIILFGALEFGVRHFAKHNRTFAERKTFIVNYSPSAFARCNLQPNQKICAFINDQLNYDSIKFHINSEGYRGHEIPLVKDSNEIRIAIVGGSHVFDPNAYDYEGYPGFSQMLESILREKGQKVTVINAGIPGACTNESILRTFFDISRFNPDYVVINSIWNDAKWMLFYSKKTKTVSTAPLAVEKNPLSEPVNLLDNILGWSSIYRKLRDFYWNKKLGITVNQKLMTEALSSNIPNSKEIKLDLAEGSNQYRQNIKLLIQIIRQLKSTPILAVEESLVGHDNTPEEEKAINYSAISYANHQQITAIYDSCTNILNELAKENNLKVIDVGSKIKHLQYFQDHVHMTAAGSKMTAEYYADFFENLLKTEEPINH